MLRSDGRHEDKGFNLTARTLACGGIRRGSWDVISSPSYPNAYPANQDCVWVLEYPEGSQIKISRNDFRFDLAPGTDGCNGDFLEIRSGHQHIPFLQLCSKKKNTYFYVIL